MSWKIKWVVLAHCWSSICGQFFTIFDIIKIKLHFGKRFKRRPCSSPKRDVDKNAKNRLMTFKILSIAIFQSLDEGNSNLIIKWREDNVYEWSVVYKKKVLSKRDYIWELLLRWTLWPLSYCFLYMRSTSWYNVLFDFCRWWELSVFWVTLSLIQTTWNPLRSSSPSTRSTGTGVRAGCSCHSCSTLVQL